MCVTKDRVFSGPARIDRTNPERTSDCRPSDYTVLYATECLLLLLSLSSPPPSPPRSPFTLQFPRASLTSSYFLPLLPFPLYSASSLSCLLPLEGGGENPNLECSPKFSALIPPAEMNLSNKFSSFAALCTLRPRVCSYRLQQRLTSKSIYPLYYNYAVGYRVCFNGEKRAFLLSIREKRFRRPLKTKGSRLGRKGKNILNVAGDKIPRPPPSLSELKGAGAPLGGKNMRCPFFVSKNLLIF